ncbi:MAG TPA: hypothetical protein VEC36_12855 [Patescibacteria group bacterium]|nr:hypothetical protein [Patescibacteria group bacterium]
MTDDELKKVVGALKTNNSEELASFGIYTFGENSADPDEFYIRANKSGLQLFAAEIIQASINSQYIIEHKEKTIIPFETVEWKDEESDILLAYIKPIKENRQQIKKPVLEPHNAFKEKIIIISVIAALIIFIICGITGFIIIVNHLFF